jgi:hypothetical protein
MQRKIQIFQVLLLLQFSCFAQNFKLWNGEEPNPGANGACQYDWGILSTIKPYEGKNCFEGKPDAWHAPGIRLNCSAWRANISNFDLLRFRAKCSTTGKTIKLSIYGWPNTSRSIDITPYITSGGGLDSTWKEIRLPIDSLKTDKFSCGASEILYFSSSPAPYNYSFFIDDIWALDTSPTKITAMRPLAADVLHLDMESRYDTLTVLDVSNYSISSKTDADFLTSQTATAVGKHWYVEDYDPADNYNNPIPRVDFNLFLTFGKKMKQGQTYTLTVKNIRDAAGNDFKKPYVQSFIYNDKNQINGSVKANHVGYLPNSSKFGYVGNWLGSLGAMLIPTAPTFQIIDAQTQNAVFNGTAVLRKSRATSSCGNHNPNIDERWSGEQVYSCDFSTLTKKGNYYLYVPNFGRSYPFNISASVYDSVYYATVRGLFYQRCGMDLKPPYADVRFQHPACHIKDAIIHKSCKDNILYNNEPIGSIIEGTRGWHDAGDYGKYVTSIAQPVFDIFTAYEMFPQKFPDAFSNIPESGNKVPDILDEVKWETDWLLGMQAPDGGVFFKTTTTDWPNNMPNLDLATRWLSPKTTNSTAIFAAIMASAARNFKPFFPNYADTCLARSKKAWNFLEKHLKMIPEGGFKNPSGIGGGEYPDPEGDLDDRAWAAAELYKTTGDTAFHTKFTYYFAQHNPNFGWNSFQHHQHKAAWAYCTTKFATNKTTIDNYKAIQKTGMEDYTIPFINESAYRCSYRSEVIPWIAWGSWAQSSQYTWNMIKTGFLLGKDYSNTAKINLDVQLGNNPQNRSYITGIGYDYPMDPLHHPSNSDGVKEPVPGIPVFGPHDYLGSIGYAGATQNPYNLYPAGNHSCSPYPTLRRYYDVFENVAMSEFGVEAMVRAAISFAYFSSIDATKIAVKEVQSSEKTSLLSIFPNPTQGESTIQFQCETAQKISLILYNILGQPIKILYEGNATGTTQTLDFSVTLPKGSYKIVMKNEQSLLNTLTVIIQ